MKKLLLVLLVVALAAFLLVGCNPVTPPVEGEGEGEEQGGVTVVIEGAAVVDSKTYVSEGDHTITVTFPAPVAGIVTANITACGGDYSKDKAITVDSPVVLFPDATKKIWTGSGTFAASDTECCASYVEVTSGECTELVCIALPVIVDGAPPYSTVEVSSDECDCDGCEVTFESFTEELVCEDISGCGDDCSGLASWSFDLYKTDPFDKCCLVPCVEPVYTCSGLDCPILCTTSCLAGPTAAQLAISPSAVATYYVVETLADAVGNTQKYYAKITLNDSCVVTVAEYIADLDVDGDGVFDCPTFDTPVTDVNITPSLTQVTLIMAVNPTGGGTTTPTIGAHPSYAANQVVSITAAPASGYHFVNWTGAVANSNLASTTVTMDANKTVTANFELDAAAYTLTMAVNPTGGGITNPAVGAHPGYAANQVVNITASPASGYHFVNWTGAVTGSVNPTTVTMNANKTVTANFDLTDVNDGPEPVDLGSASTFGIMATAAITDASGDSFINGDVSLDPGTSCGLLPAQVSGTIHINDTVSEQARIDLLIAYNSAKTLPPGTTISAGADLGFLYPLGIPPGTYTSGSTMLVSTPLILDAGGNANAVWVFQIGSSLTTSANVSLANGAQEKNVFWVPTSDATIGVGTIFYGTIVSGRDVTAVTGTTIYGRILAGAITDGTIALQTTTVNVPAP